MKQPIAIVNNNPAFADLTCIDWNLGTLCNYACSYCPERLHDGALKWPEPKVALRFCGAAINHYQSLGRRTFFKFSGGEPTLYKHLIGLLRGVKELGGNAGLNSNASREPAWWDQAVDYLDHVVLTYHIEFSDTEHFVAVANRLIEAGVVTHVNVPMLPERFDECAERASALRSRCRGISLALKPLLVDFKDQMYLYSHEQKQAMQELAPAPAGEGASRTGMQCIYGDGTARVAQTQDFILREENYWRSWHCNAGIESLAIRADGGIYRAVCKQGGLLGNLADRSYSFPAAPIRCAKDTCACLADIKISKWRGENPALSVPQRQI